MKEELSKTDAAVRQLEMAIRLFFEGRDYVPVHTLAAAADGILQDLCDKNRSQVLQRRKKADKPLKFSVKEELEILVKPEFRDEAFKLFYKTQNFLKHANRDSESLLELNSRDQAYARISSAIHNYEFLNDQVTQAMQIFLIWMLSEKPKLVSDDAPDRDEFLKALEGIQKIGPEIQNEMFLHHLKNACPHLFKVPTTFSFT